MDDPALTLRILRPGQGDTGVVVANVDRSSGAALVKDVFRPGLEAHLARKDSHLERRRTAERLQAAFSQVLQFAPVEADAVTVMRIRAIIAASGCE
ncbi:hypothetical protein [Roseomonas chloroacetimidivorans]|uniref:hypothetical protein n=1 Tax=Roseomonas chloroacetimidivorans TaxID=1766656 RepID=UPI003C7433EF